MSNSSPSIAPPSADEPRCCWRGRQETGPVDRQVAMAAIGPSGKRRHNRGSHRGGNFVGRAQQPGRSSSDKECGLMAQKKAAEPIAPRAKLRSEERRVGEEWLSTCRSGGAACQLKKKKNKIRK